jgi:hypothetical protein
MTTLTQEALEPYSMGSGCMPRSQTLVLTGVFKFLLSFLPDTSLPEGKLNYSPEDELKFIWAAMNT